MRASRRAPRRGRHDEPHAAGRLPGRDGRLDGRDPAGAPVELPRGRVHGGRRRPPSSRSSPRRPRCRSCSTSGSGLLDAERGFPGEEPTRAPGAGRRRRPRHVQRRQAARRPAGRLHRRARRPDREAAQAPARARDADRQAPGRRRSRRRSPLYATGAPRRGPRAPDDPREPSSVLAEAGPRAVRGDRGRPRGRARRATASRSSAAARCPGSGSRPWGVRVRCPDPPAFAARLRSGSPSVFCRVAGRSRAARRADRHGRAGAHSSPARSSTPWKATTSTTRTDP